MFKNLIQYILKPFLHPGIRACFTTKVNLPKNLRLVKKYNNKKPNYNCRESNKFIEKKPLVDTITSKKGSHKFPTR